MSIRSAQIRIRPFVARPPARCATRSVIALAVLLLWVGGQFGVARAGQPTPGGAATYRVASTTVPGPDELLREGVMRLNRFLAERGADDPEKLQAFLDHEIAPYFDFAYMSRWAAGRHYPYLSRAERDEFTERLRDLFLSALARNLGSYARPLPRIDVFPARAGRSPNEVAVLARVLPREGFSVRLEFRYYWSRQGWKIFDVAANGASAVAYYRRYFSEQWSRNVKALAP